MKVSTDELDGLIDEGCDLAEGGRHLEAIRHFQSAIDRGEAWVGLNLGNSYLALGDVSAAQRAYEQAWEAGDGDAGFNLAHLFESKGEVLRARNVLAVLVERNYAKAQVEEAMRLRADGRISEAESLLSRAMSDPGPIGDLAAGVLGNMRWRGPSSDEELLTRGATAYPSARADLAVLQIETGRNEEGETTLRKGVAADEVESMIVLGNRLSRNGDTKAAEELFRRGFALGDAHAALNLGALRWEAGRRKSARKWFRRAAALGDERAQEWLESN